MRLLFNISMVIIALALLTVSCSKETPSRDHIPVLKERVYSLQQAVKERNRPAIDSLMAPEIRSLKQGPDSLLCFVYGLDDKFAFERFGDCDIVYTADKARIDCYVMDSTAQTIRPIVLTFIYKHKLWLLKRFEPGQARQDST